MYYVYTYTYISVYALRIKTPFLKDAKRLQFLSIKIFCQCKMKFYFLIKNINQTVT